MPLVSANELQELFNLPAKAAQRMDIYIGEAARALKRWVGETPYNEAAASTPVGDADRNAAFKYAEAHLAFAFALPNLATVLNHRGVVKEEQAEGSAQLSYYTDKEISQRIADLREIAKSATRCFWIAPDVDEGTDFPNPALVIEVAETQTQFTVGKHITP
jgi:hypothetical protein